MPRLLVPYLLVSSVLSIAPSRSQASEIDKPTLAWMQLVLDRWDETCRRRLRAPLEPLPWIIFYDQNRALHLNAEKQLLPPHQNVQRSLKFVNRSYPIAEVRHTDRLWVPGQAPLSTSPTAVAMLYANEQQPFFIVPLPALFRTLAEEDQAPLLDELFVGFSLHELAHTRQIVYAARRLKRMRMRFAAPESLHDNLIQDMFGKDDEYVKMHQEEQKQLTEAILASDASSCLTALERALSIADRRRARFFTGDKKFYAELEDIFLAMEGLGMWVHYRSARDHAPKDQNWLQTMAFIAERTDAWSQQTGIGLFLLIDRLVPNWPPRLLAPDFPSPYAVLREALAAPGSEAIWRPER